MVIDLNDYVAGGYFVVKYTETSDHGFRPSELLPERVFSVRGCRSATFEIYWGWDIEKHKLDALHFDIANEKLMALSEWINESHYSETEHPNVFLKADYALNFATEFLDLSNDFIVIGIGLHHDLVDKFLNENDYSHDEKHGLIRLLHEHSPIKPGGEILGFEPVGYNINFSCSWLCNGLEKDMNELFGIRPNQYGLIDSYVDAKKVYEWIAEDEMKGTRAEPEPYYPWLIVQYPL